MTDEEVITLATLFGGNFNYNDYGHPERAGSRKYYTCTGPLHPGGRSTYVIGYGYSYAEAARDWLRRTGNDHKIGAYNA